MALTKTIVKRLIQPSGSDFSVLEDGTGVKAQGTAAVDADGNHIAFGINYSSAAAEDSKIVSAVAGSVGEVWCYQDGLSGTALTVMMFDSATLPSNGTAPAWRIPLISGTGGYSFPTAFQFTAGLVVAFSTSHDTLTVSTGSEGFIHTRSR